MKKNAIILVLFSLLLVDLCGMAFAINFGIFPMKKSMEEDVPQTADVSDIDETQDAVQDVTRNNTQNIARNSTPDSTQNSTGTRAYPEQNKNETGVGQKSASNDYSINETYKARDPEQKKTNVSVLFMTEKKTASLLLFAAMICLCVGIICVCGIFYCIRTH